MQPGEEPGPGEEVKDPAVTAAAVEGPPETETAKTGVRHWVAEHWRAARRWLGESTPDMKVGTLQYSGKSLLIVCLWLFWGDVVFTFSGEMYAKSFNFQLDRLKVPREWIGYLQGTAGAMVNMILIPIIAFRSDRTRTKWGRRIPYLMWSIVPMSLSLALLGFTDDVGAWARTSDWPARLHLSPVAMILILVGTMIGIFDVCNVFANTVWLYLVRDVIPGKHLGRFLAIFGIIATGIHWIWFHYFQEHIETHTRNLYLGAAAVYLVGFTVMCKMVKEGQYPPPQKVEGRPGWITRFISAARMYFKQCTSHPMVMAMYATGAFAGFSIGCSTYTNLFLVRHGHITQKQMALYWEYQALALMVIKFPIGWLIDKKIHPIKSTFYAGLLLLPVSWLFFFVGDYQWQGMVISAYAVWVAIWIYQFPIVQFQALASLPLQSKIYPAEQFGQFSASGSMIGSLAAVIGGILGATFMGWAFNKFGDYGYGFAFMWHGLFALIGFISSCVMLRYWKLFGGPKFKLDLAAGWRVGGPTRGALLRPIVIAGVAAMLVLAGAAYGAVVMTQRPDLGFEVNAQLPFAKSVADLRVLAAENRAEFEQRHARNLEKLAKKHWFHEGDSVTERKNYHSAMAELETLQGATEEKLQKAAAAASAPATGAATAPSSLPAAAQSKP